MSCQVSLGELSLVVKGYKLILKMGGEGGGEKKNILSITEL